MNITFDATKDAINQQKHGVSLADAAYFEWDSCITLNDTRRDYGEERYIAFGYLHDRIYCVVFTDRANNERRIISLRKANSREIRRHVET
ncbi:BrnT family toxin [Serratia marcescens]|uniref:BrnT family toxin n=1 Tax=Serratia marcescens TaxID=615 RepID=UPI001BA17B9F|nr:BrnT family toxin [Serratia marcescens]ULH10629.1 BrnT family toxin [Serratia marcescens]HBC7420864.1 BrnT family toxin [Serratia marcescens]